MKPVGRRSCALEIAGVDYVLNREGPHFIELNPFPRVGLSEQSAELARGLFARRMEAIEKTERTRPRA